MEKIKWDDWPDTLANPDGEDWSLDVPAPTTKNLQFLANAFNATVDEINWLKHHLKIPKH